MSLVVSQAVDSPLTRAAIFLVVALKPGGRFSWTAACDHRRMVFPFEPHAAP